MDLVLINRKDTDSPDLTEAARCAYIYTRIHFWIFLDILDLPWDNRLAIASTIHYQGKDQTHQDCTVVWILPTSAEVVSSSSLTTLTLICTRIELPGIKIKQKPEHAFAQESR